jgi:hypothetical protein
MRSLLVLVLFILACGQGCLWFSQPLPDWALSRQVDKDFYYGVGSCSKARTPERMRNLAIARAFYEICSQAKGACRFDIRVKEETYNGGVTLEMISENGKKQTVSGAAVINEFLSDAGGGGFEEDTLFILLRFPKTGVDW